MSKFLNLVEDHKPDIDELTDAKRSLQRLLLKNKIEAHGKAFEDIIRVRLDDGRVVELEVKDVQHSEDQESFLSKNEKDVLAVTSDLVKDPRRRSFQTDPKKDLERSYGDMIKKVAKKVKDVAKKIK